LHEGSPAKRRSINAAFVHGKFTLLSGEICMTCQRKDMREIRKRFTRNTKNPAYLFAVERYEPLRGTQNRQQLMMNPKALCMETYRVSMQKSAEGIVPSGNRREGPNV